MTTRIRFDTKMRPLAIPTVHLNGTSKQSLLDGYLAAVNAVRIAEQAVAETWPHARDYYMQPALEPGGGTKATLAADQHEDRLRRLAAVLAELEAIAEGVSDQ